MNTKKSTAIWAVAAVIVVALIAAAVWLITGDSEKQPTSADGIVEDITYTPPETSIKTQPETEATSVERTTSAAEGYVENFLAEANTYSQTVETQTTPAGQKPFFHVVTDGTVTDDKSLEGLEEPLKTVGEVILMTRISRSSTLKKSHGRETSASHRSMMPLLLSQACITTQCVLSSTMPTRTG